MSCNRHLKSGWLNLNDSVVVKEYTECLSEYLNEDVNNKHTAIMKWYTMWKDDRERRMSNGEKFYVFNVLDYMDCLYNSNALKNIYKPQNNVLVIPANF